MLEPVHTESYSLTHAFVQFQLVGMPARNLAQRTRQEYTNDIQDLIEYLTSRNVSTIQQVTLSYLEGYLAELERRGYKASSRNRKAHAIRSWFHFMERQEIIGKNVARHLIPPAAPKDDPRFLTPVEFQRLLRAVSHHIRDAAIIELFLQTGMRLSELTKLALPHVHIPSRITNAPDNTGMVRILRKGGKIKAIPLNYKACKALDAYLKIRPPVPYPQVFITKFGKPIGKRSIQKAIAKYLDEAGIAAASVHSLRHTFGTEHARKGTSIKTIQDTLGHATLATTTRYVSLVEELQREELQRNAL